MATLPCKSHWWQKPSCILKCLVTFLTPESNFSRGRLSQSDVLTNPYRSGLRGWHSCPSSSPLFLESLELEQTRSCELQGPHPTLPTVRGELLSAIWLRRQSKRGPGQATTQAIPQGHPRCKLLLMDIERQSHSTPKEMNKTLVAPYRQRSRCAHISTSAPGEAVCEQTFGPDTLAS